MRTTGKIAVVIGGGLLLAGGGCAPGAPVAGAPVAVAAVRPSVRPVPAASAATRTVRYAGYAITVPAGWPVYRLDADPARCVRYDVHAVYLGTPGTDQQCPAGLIGRTETVSIIPAPAAAAAAIAAGPAVTGIAGAGQAPAAVRGQMRSDLAAHQITVAVGSPGATASGRGPRALAGAPAVTAGASVVATYGADPALIQRVLGTLRPAVPAGQPSPLQDAAQPPGAGASRPPASAAPASGPPASAAPASGQAAAAPVSAPPAPAQWHALPPARPVMVVERDPAPVTPARRPLLGFDACTAPSLPVMRAWRRYYAAVGIYIGGTNVACDSGNLSRSWVRSAAAMGWSMLPAYVGPQAPCTGFSSLIAPGRAAAQGGGVADDAVRAAVALGLPKGSLIYYDMEAYHGGPACSAAVLAFLGAWTRQLHARGYVSGVYSARNSGIADMRAAAAARRPGFTAPRAVWIAWWDGRGVLGGGSPLWPLTARSKQFIGPHNVTIGGFTLNIDTDLVSSPVFHGG